MIALLTGTVVGTGENDVILDVGGVGYLVFASQRTLSQLPPVGETARLMIETHVREDHIHLYGFAHPTERAWFRRLLAVQGVGARVALAILSVLTPEELTQAIAAQDKSAVSQAEGVGPKLAARVVSELKDKVDGIVLTMAREEPSLPAGDAATDAVSALVNLGYRRAEAFGAVARAATELGPEATAEAMIRAGLKELSL